MLRVLQLLSAAVVVLTSLPAVAAFSFAPGYPRRDDGRPVVLAATGASMPNPLEQPHAGFNRADCFDTSQAVRIMLTDIPVEATDVEIWARRSNSTSCADPSHRPGGANVQCWKVASFRRDEIVNKEVSFKPLQLIQAIDKQTSVDTADGLDPTAACAKDAHMTPVVTSLQVMAFNSGTVVGWSYGTAGAVIGAWTAYDLAGPNPPRNVMAAPREGGLQVNFEVSSSPPPDFDGYALYCFPGTGSTCPSGPLLGGRIPSAEDEKYLCGLGTTASGTMSAMNLPAHTPHAVAVGARDKAGNVGPLSEVVCATSGAAPPPNPTTPTPAGDDDTVKSGCGCRVGAPQSASFGVAAVALALAIAARRRQR